MKYLVEYNRQGDNLEDYATHTKAQIRFLRLVRAVQSGHGEDIDADEHLMDAAEDMPTSVVSDIVDYYKTHSEAFGSLPDKVQDAPAPKKAGKTYQQGRKVYRNTKDTRTGGEQLYRATQAARRRVAAALQRIGVSEKPAKVLSKTLVKVATARVMAGRLSDEDYEDDDDPSNTQGVNMGRGGATPGTTRIMPEPRMSDTEKAKYATSTSPTAKPKATRLSQAQGPQTKADLARIRKMRGAKNRAGTERDFKQLSRSAGTYREGVVGNNYFGGSAPTGMSQPGQPGHRHMMFDNIMEEFYSCGRNISGKAKMSQVAGVLAKIAEHAHGSVNEEATDWFDKHTIARHMKELSAYAKEFEKLSQEADQTQLRMRALYDDMGGVLERYFNVKDHDPHATPVMRAHMGESVDFDSNAVKLALTSMTDGAIAQFTNLHESVQKQIAWKIVLNEGDSARKMGVPSGAALLRPDRRKRIYASTFDGKKVPIDTSDGVQGKEYAVGDVDGNGNGVYSAKTGVNVIPATRR